MHEEPYVASCGKRNAGQLLLSLTEAANNATANDRMLLHSEIFLQKIFAEAASIGEQPVVLSLDARLSRERSDTRNAWFASGQVDGCSIADQDEVQATYHKDGGLPDTAQFGAKGVDFLVCNRCAWAHISSFLYRFDLKIPCHVVTELVLSSQPFSPMCTVWAWPRESLPKEREGLQNLKQTVANLWKTLLNTSRGTCVNTSRTRISTLHGTPGYKLLRSIKVVPRPSELLQTRGQRGRSSAPVFRQQQVSASGRRAFPTDGASSRTLTRVQQVLDLAAEMWRQSSRHAQMWPPTCDQLPHAWKTWHRLLQ